MRRIVLFVVVLIGLGVAGCSSQAPASLPEQTRPATATIDVFLARDVTDSQKQAIEASLRAVPGATEVSFRTREEAYRVFKELYKDQTELINTVTPADLPESYQVTLPDRTSAESTILDLQKLPGVNKVSMRPTATPSPPR